MECSVVFRRIVWNLWSVETTVTFLLYSCTALTANRPDTPKLNPAKQGRQPVSGVACSVLDSRDRKQKRPTPARMAKRTWTRTMLWSYTMRHQRTKAQVNFFYWLMDARRALVTKHLPFTREIRKFCLENQMVRVLPFGKLQKTWAVIRGDAIFLLFLVCSGDLDIHCIITSFLSDTRELEVWSFCILGQWFAQIFRVNRHYWVKALRKTNLIASSHFKREESSLPVDLPRSKTSLLKVSYNSVSVIHSVDLQIHFVRVCCYMGTPDGIYEGRLALLQLHVRSRLAL